MGEKKKQNNKNLQSLSQWQLMWRKFKKNKMGMLGMSIVISLYIITIFSNFFAPYNIHTRNFKYIYAPPQKIHIFDENGLTRPFVYGLQLTRDPESLRRIYKTDKSKKYHITLFKKGSPYKLLGLFSANIRLFGTDIGHIYLLGTDKFGRDLFSRILWGGKISLSVGLLGVLLSLTIGSFMGTMSGYYGGKIDMVLQRITEIVMAFPRIPLWLALSAALPPGWSSLKIYFGIVTILSLIGWASLARVVRGKILSVQKSEFIAAAKAVGSSDFWIISRHLIPNILSHIIVVATLSVPGMILAESSLSFLGLGIQAPMTSWGVLLKEAQNVRTLLLHPWLAIPGIFIIITVLSFNFAGDGLRDAADPFSQ